MRCTALALLVACSTEPAIGPDAAATDAPREVDAAPRVPLAIASVTDLGKLPLPPLGVGRDGGMSGMLGGKVRWSFGDTFLTQKNSIDHSSVLSATSGWSTFGDPLALTHALAPTLTGSEPAQLIPYTAAEVALNTADATTGYALWPGPLLDVGEPHGVVSFNVIKRDGANYASEGIGTARIGVDDPVAVRHAGLLFAPPETLFQPQIVLDDFAYAFACEKRGFLDFACKLARAPRAMVEVHAAYTFYDGASWVADIARSAYVIDQTSVAPSISYNAHLGRYLAVTCELLSSTVMLRTAPAIEGPWTEAVTIAAGATGILAPTHADQWNYLCVEHPELATDNGRAIVVGYSRPTEPFLGDVRLARITLE